MKAARARETGVGGPVVRGDGLFADTDHLSFQTGRTVLKPEASTTISSSTTTTTAIWNGSCRTCGERPVVPPRERAFRKEHDLLRSAIRERP